MRDTAKDDARSGDVLYSLFSWQKLDKNEIIKNYQQNVIDPARAKAPSGTFYGPDAYGKYDISAVSDYLMPLTSLGERLASAGIDVVSFNYTFRQGSAKLLQILIIAGFLCLFLSDKFVKKLIDDEFLLIAVGSMLLILSQIVLPVLSVEYGLLRAFQQSLIFLSIFVVIGSTALVAMFGKRIQLVFAGSLAIIFFLSSTGVITQILGGYPPQLHLNNEGLYYDTYYLHGTEIAGIEWLQNNLPHDMGADYQSETQTDRYAFLNTQSISNGINTISTLNDIYPALIRKDSYVYLGFTNTNKYQSILSYDGNLITYKYPVQFLDEKKSIIYSNVGVKIYK